MLLRLFWRYLRGFVKVRCEGGLHSRFFDRLLKEEIDVFQIHMQGNTAYFCVFLRDYHKLRPIAKKCQCRVRIETKHGLYFSYVKLPYKAGTAVGLAVFCAVIFLLGNMVFTVEIKGGSTIPRDVLLTSLEKYGLRPGIWQGDVDVKAVEHGLMFDNDRLSWVAVNLSFGRATVEVKDKDAFPEETQHAARIVAKRDAQVKSVEVISGHAVAGPGQVVVAGQTLVEVAPATLENSWTENVNAKIIGYTEYTRHFTLDRQHIFRTETGNTIRTRVLYLGNGTIPLSLRRNVFRYFDVVTYETPVTVFGVRLPLRVVTTEYMEMNQVSVSLNEVQAKLMLLEYQSDYEKENLSHCEILNRDTEFAFDGANYVYTVQYLCLEEIGEYMYS